MSDCWYSLFPLSLHCFWCKKTPKLFEYKILQITHNQNIIGCQEQGNPKEQGILPGGAGASQSLGLKEFLTDTEFLIVLFNQGKINQGSLAGCKIINIIYSNSKHSLFCLCIHSCPRIKPSLCRKS